ncbi:MULTISPECIES: bifunctional 2-polyprenyl-6-hydroxyphenol methylase/3-demethylubiquinol 3-O-methyltransferase UbiG [Glaesserella]|uniref:SAM-dependent methyltransferase n=1 Tax=Glaesserella australis TaxID=2094024 RepID=A0A328BXW2_9PAST|nr:MULTISPECIES: class I SAM-dependent methyltransferase [Glaesserella]AUI65249.1 SAM-dependent methyltransferase [Glaesserella sp. 15-184]RAL18521.1 SAM-dependent methyltransferase [Glaesserella australis]
MKTSIYDNPIFFERYLKLRENPISLNEVVEKPTMFSLLPDLNGKKVLDLGCGAGGHLLHYLALGAKQVVGLDLSQAMIEQARVDFAKKDVNPTAYRFYCLPMEALSTIEEADFDVITSSFAFHYVKDLPELLQQISAKLVLNGLLIFSQEHPIVTCFKEGDRWEKDARKQQVAYRLNYYRDEGERNRNWFQQSFKTYHRTTATILNSLIQGGFNLEQVEEPMLAEQTEWHNEFKDLRHRPPLLFIKSVKK